eukprot:SAG31_NODE_17_length_35773_cov_25.999271_24_plen_49_part_00
MFLYVYCWVYGCVLTTRQCTGLYFATAWVLCTCPKFRTSSTATTVYSG